jgi:vitamin B12 transporter
MRNRFLLWGLMGALTFFNASVLSAETTEKEENLEDVFVTATRTEQDFGKLGGSSVSLVDFETIDAKKQFTLADVLKGIPGIDINSYSGMGSLTSVYMRGADSKNTLVLIDGMMFNDPADPNRGANIENITTDAIERIEVVRGPMSVLYGSNATAGVINIITKKGSGKPSVSASLEGGSYNTLKYNGALFGTVERFNYSLIGAKTDTRGFSSANDENNDIPHGGNTSEKDGWENKSLYGKFGYDFNRDFDITANFLVLDSRLDLDEWYYDSFSYNGYAGDRFAYDAFWNLVPEPDGSKKKKTERDQAAGKIKIHNVFFNRRLDSQLSFQASEHKAEEFHNDGYEEGEYTGKSREWAWQGGVDPAASHMLDFGLNFYEEEMTQNSTWTTISDKSSDTRSLWLQDELFLLDNLVLIAGARYDDHDKFGGKTTYRAAPAYYWNNTTLKASFGTGFRSPSLFELYSSYGNENLKPEKSMGWDAGLEQALFNQKAKAGITYFSTVFEDRIGTHPATWLYDQLEGETKTKGIEAFIACQLLPDLDLTLDYTYTDTEDPEGERLARRPYHKIHLNAKYKVFEKALMNLDAFRVGERDEDFAMDKDGNVVNSLDAYTLVNLSAQYKLTDHVNVHARVDNLFDEFYENVWSFATPGRSGYVGMKLTY